MDEPVISVVGTVFNQSLRAERTLWSYLNQDFDLPYEIIICDDGSTDDTRDMIRRMMKEYPNMMRYFYFNRPDEQCFVKPFNRGIKESRADIIVVAMGIDRIVLPNALKQMYDPHMEQDKIFVTLLNRHLIVKTSKEVVPENEVTAVLDSIDWMNNRGRLYEIMGKRVPSRLHVGKMTESPTFSIKRKHLFELGSYDERYTSVHTTVNINLWSRMVDYGLGVIYGDPCFHQPHKASRGNRLKEEESHRFDGKNHKPTIRNQNGWGNLKFDCCIDFVRGIDDCS